LIPYSFESFAASGGEFDPEWRLKFRRGASRRLKRIFRLLMVAVYIYVFSNLENRPSVTIHFLIIYTVAVACIAGASFGIAFSWVALAETHIFAFAVIFAAIRITITHAFILITVTIRVALTNAQITPTFVVVTAALLVTQMFTVRLVVTTFLGQ